MSQELILRQIELEEESVRLGEDRYSREKDYLTDKKREDTSRPGQHLMRSVIDTVAEAIEIDRNTKRRGKNRLAVDLVSEVDSAALAWLGLRALVAGISRTQTYVQVAIRAGRSIQEDINYQRFNEQNKHKYKITQEHIKQAHSERQKRKIMSALFRGEEIDGVKWAAEDLARVGSYVLDISIKITGWAKVCLKKTSSRTTAKIIQPNKELLEWLEDAHSQLALLSPVRQPMLVEPEAWTGPRGGGYITNHGGSLDLVKTINAGYLDSLDQVEMPEVYTAVNTIQSTPWKINKRILETAQELWKMGTQVGHDGDESLPSPYPKEVPARPAKWGGMSYQEIKVDDYDEYKLWSSRAAVVHEYNRRMVSKRVTAGIVMEMAKKFADDTIYFPCQLDFRGRIYPVTSYLNPQGDELQKALLLFAEGKPLGPEGSKWLQVHVANCFGVDKVSFEERIQWTQAHMEALMDSGMDPLGGDRYWMEADEPFLALAACMELVGYSIEGDDFVSHLPISMDGSCNGLQNFSALLRDEVGGRATNLVPMETPADIYNEVAEVTNRKVVKAATEGHSEAVIFDGFINRSLIKQPVMTLPYGATLAGMQSQLEDACKKAGNPMALTQKNSWKACGYLSKVVRESIGEVVVAAVSAMDWLQEVARTLSSEDHPVSWTTPCGLPVLQEYRQRNARVIRIHIDGVKQKLHVNEDGKKLDKRRQALGIAPNFVHSLDAAHLMKTTLLARENGIGAFAMVHDSFGTHASDVSVLQACIREAFIQMYSGDVLQEFKEEVEYQHGAPLPDTPAMGTLDLDLVRESEYFFA